VHSGAECLPAGRARSWQAAVCGTRARLHGDDAGAEFVRFVTVGVSSSVVYFGLFLVLRGLGAVPANVVAFVVSSALANELHRRLTFHAGERVSWLTAQWEGGGMALVGMVATALALAWWDATTDTGASARFVVVVPAPALPPRPPSPPEPQAQDRERPSGDDSRQSSSCPGGLSEA
jgi:hypothetical protein